MHSLMSAQPSMIPPEWTNMLLIAGWAMTIQQVPTVMASWQHKIE